MRLPAPIAAALAFVTTTNAAVTLAPLFRDGAVLQRDKPVPVWGSADAGESLTVAFAGQSVSATADADGRWSATLNPLPASAEPRDLVVSGRNRLVVRDVVVGEVWLASGQSNMTWPLANVTNGKADVKAADFPLLRQFKVAQQSSFTPCSDVGGAWAPALPATAGQFTAVGYYFGLSLHRKLNVPVGIIHSAWAGTEIAPWVSPEAYRADPAIGKLFALQEKAPRATPEAIATYEAQRAAWEKAKTAGPPPAPPSGLPGTRTIAGLNNGMIAPLAPYALRGAIWYQGEANADHASRYAPYFSALITGWRQQFAQGDFPFYWVQLPNFEAGNARLLGWAQLREAQTHPLALPNTGQAVTIDVGEDKNNHPKNKKPVGERLALLALARTYDVRDVIDRGPVFASAKREDYAYRVAFDPATGPLESTAPSVTGFELAGEDRVFHDAEARIDGASVVVTCAAVTAPVAVRYAYRNAPVAGLFNAAGLPAAPFRTDTW